MTNTSLPDLVTVLLRLTRSASEASGLDAVAAAPGLAKAQKGDHVLLHGADCALAVIRRTWITGADGTAVLELLLDWPAR